MADNVASTSAAPFAQRKSTRTQLRRMRVAQRVLGVVFIALTAAAWVALIDFRQVPPAVLVPFLVVATAPALFARRPWISLLPRVSLWASLFCGASCALFVKAPEPDRIKLVALAVAASAGLVSLGRFARSIGKLRPLLVALVSISLADALTTGLFSTLITLDATVSANDLKSLLMLASASLANIAGVSFILWRRRFAPHIIGNAAVVVLNLFDVGRLDELRWFLVVPALGQIALAFAQRIPRASSRTRRRAELALRVGLVVLGLVVASTLCWR
jgi:hypothetical protein